MFDFLKENKENGKTVKLTADSVGKTFLCRNGQYYGVVERHRESNGNSPLKLSFGGKLMRVRDNVQDGDMVWDADGVAGVNKVGHNHQYIGHFDLVDTYEFDEKDMTVPPAMSVRTTKSNVRDSEHF
jgi:hypothetical protein